MLTVGLFNVIIIQAELTMFYNKKNNFLYNQSK
jgi:hypothetical protein